MVKNLMGQVNSLRVFKEVKANQAKVFKGKRATI